MTTVPLGDPPTMTKTKTGRYIVRGDPRGPLAHHWSRPMKVLLYRTERGALKALAQLGAAYRHRKDYWARIPR